MNFANLSCARLRRDEALLFEIAMRSVLRSIFTRRFPCPVTLATFDAAQSAQSRESPKYLAAQGDTSLRATRHSFDRRYRPAYSQFLSPRGATSRCCALVGGAQNGLREQVLF
jgi:hypothetical protein